MNLHSFRHPDLQLARSNSPCSQLRPQNPSMQVQLYFKCIPSHVALFRHGLDWHGFKIPVNRRKNMGLGSKQIYWSLNCHNNWSLNKGLFPFSIQKYISLICGLRTSENLAWWSRTKPDNKRCAFLALIKACHELPFPFIIRPLRDCGSSRFTRPSLRILRLRGHRSSSFNLGSDRFCLTAKNQTISDDTNW